MTDLDLPVDVKPLSLPGVFTAQYEIDTLPLLFSSDAVFNQYYEALVRKNSHVAARLEDLRNRNSLARQHRMAGLWQECVDTLWQCVEARRELFDATDFQITAAQRHFVMTLLNFATYFLREGGNGRTSAEEAMFFRSFGLFKRAEEAVTVIDDRSDRMLLKAMVDNNYAAYYMRRRKQKAAYQRMGSAIKAYNAYLKLTTGKGLEGAGGGLRGTGTGSRSVGGEGGIISRRTSSAAVQQANAAMSSGFGGHSSSDSDSDAEGGDHTKKNKNKSSDLPANMSDAEFKSRTEALYFAFQSGTGDIFAGNFEDSLKKLLAAVKNAEILQKAVDAPLASSSSGEVSPSPKKSSGGEANNESPIARSKLITDKEKNNTNDTISSKGGESGATTAKDSSPLASSQIAIEQSPTKKSSRASSRASDRSSSRHSSVSSRASSRVTASSHHKSRSSSSVSSRASASAAHSPNKEGGEASENVYSSDAYSSSDDDDGGSPKTRGRGKKSQSPKREKVKPEDKAEKKEVSTPQHDDSLAERKKEEDDELPLSASSSPRSGAETTPTKQRRSSTSPRAAAAAPTDGGFAIQIIGSAAPTDVLAVIALYHNIAVAYVGLRKHRDAAKWAQRALDVSAANGDSGVRSDSTFVKIIVRCKEFCDKMSFRQRRLQDARGAAAANDTTIVGKQVRGLLMMRAASVGSARQRASSNTSSRRGTSADINRRQNAEEDRKSAIVAREAFNHPKSAEAAKAYLPRHTAPSPSASGRTPRYAEPTAVEKLQTYLKGLSYRQLVEDYGIDDGGRYYKMQQQQKKRHTKEDKEKSRLQREQSQREKEEAKKAEKERVKKRQEATEQRRADLISAQQSRVVTPRGPAAAPTSTSTAAHSAVGSRATTPRGGGNKGASSPPAAVPSATTASTRGAIPPPPPPPPPPASHHNEDNAAKNDAHEKKESNEEDDNNNNNTLPREEKNEHHLDGIEAKAQHLEEPSAKEQEKDDEKVNDDSNLNNESNTDQKAEDAIPKTAAATDTKKADDGDENEKVSQKEEKEASEGAEEDDNISNSEDEADAAARQKAEEARLSAQAKAITEMAPSSNSKANEEVNVSAQKDRDEEEKAVIANAATPPASDTPRVAEKENTSSTPPPPPPPLPLNAQTLSAAAASANRTEKKRTEEKGYSDGEEDFEKDSSVFSSLPNSARKGAPTSAEADVDETKPAEIVVALADANQQKQQIARSGTPPLEPAPPTEISAVVSSSIEIKDKSEHAPPAAKDNNHDNTFGYDDDDFAPESPMKRTADGEARDQKQSVEEDKEKTDSIKSDLSSRPASTPPSPPSPTTPLQQPAATSDSKTEQEEKEAEKVAGGVDDDEAAGYGSDEFEDESPRKENKAARAVALSDDVADDKEKLETKLASAAEEDVAPKSSAVADNEEQKEVEDYSEEDEDDAYGDEDFESSPANSPSKNLIGAAIPNDADEEQREEEDAKAFDEAEQSVPAAEEREEPYADDDFEEEL